MAWPPSCTEWQKGIVHPILTGQFNECCLLRHFPWIQIHLRAIQWNGKKQCAQTETQEIPFKYKKKAARELEH